METITSVDGTEIELAYPLDRDDPRVQAARKAEQRAYEHYGIEFTNHFVDVPSIKARLRVAEVGTGPPVVMVPGDTGHGTSLLLLLPGLENHTVYIMDRPGGGLSDGIDYRSHTMGTIATRTIAAVFDHFGLENVPLIGNSIGGTWSLRFALEHPDSVSAIVLLGCPPLYPGTSLPLPMRLMSLPGIGNLLIERVGQPHSVADVRDYLVWLGHPDETVQRLPDELLEASYRMDNLPHFKLTWVSATQSITSLLGSSPEESLTDDDLQNVRSPVLLIWGSEDPFGSSEMGRTGAEHFPDAEFHAVGTGHFPWLDEPERCRELIHGFTEQHY
ncbi:alpha/beta hydrolase [Halomontanus rarus]|uniref:alpha/beta fold hydrolase n=1 Tax=Halomontanus rarus TaxID=3034020 RepID=UPI00293B98F0|nr:alpha/beta hydrolase [Halovivax sp. KZCA124]